MPTEKTRSHWIDCSRARWKWCAFLVSNGQNERPDMCYAIRNTFVESSLFINPSYIRKYIYRISYTTLFFGLFLCLCLCVCNIIEKWIGKCVEHIYFFFSRLRQIFIENPMLNFNISHMTWTNSYDVQKNVWLKKKEIEMSKKSNGFDLFSSLAPARDSEKCQRCRIHEMSNSFIENNDNQNVIVQLPIGGNVSFDRLQTFHLNICYMEMINETNEIDCMNIIRTTNGNELPSDARKQMRAFICRIPCYAWDFKKNNKKKKPEFPKAQHLKPETGYRFCMPSLFLGPLSFKPTSSEIWTTRNI